MLIGEIARATGVTTKTLRYYEDEGLLHEPDRAANGYRDYSADVVPRVEFIRHAQAAGLTLHQIHTVLTIRDDGHTPCGDVAELVAERLTDVIRRIRELQETHARLRQFRSAWPSSTRPTASPPASARPSRLQAPDRPVAYQP